MLKFNLTIMITILISIITIQSSQAAEIGVITGSRHFDTKTEYNESNPGAYVIHENYIVGGYKNSYFTPTVFAGPVVTHRPYKHVKLSLAYGVSYGYGWDNGLADPANGGAKALLFVLPTVSIERNGYYLNTHIVGNAMAWSISKRW